MSILSEILFDYTLRTVSLGSALLGIVSGILGTYAILRKQSLLGDAVSHAALPGIGLAFLITSSKNTAWLLLGAFIAGWLATYLINNIRKSSRIKYDSALAMILAVFFGLGLMLLTYIQKIPDSNQAGLEDFLFGQASTLLQRDVILMAIVAIIIIIPIIIFWKEFKLLSFDPVYSKIIGFNPKKVDLILTTLTVLAIVMGLQTVGVVLMSSMLIAPAVAARQWTDKLSLMIVLAAIFGAVSGVTGTVISSTTSRMPTGPVIVLVATLIAFFSMLFAPGRGIIWKKIREYLNRRELNTNIVLSNLYAFSKNHEDPFHAHDLSNLSLSNTGIKYPKRKVKRELYRLKILGLVNKHQDDIWSITTEGVKKIETLFAGERSVSE